jgi:hypothetical protein
VVPRLVCLVWLLSDLPGLRVLVRLYDAVERGEFQRAGELRLWLDGLASRRKAVRSVGSGSRRRTQTRSLGRRLVAGITVICGSWMRSLRRWTRFGLGERTVHGGTLDPDRPTMSNGATQPVCIRRSSAGTEGRHQA